MVSRQKRIRNAPVRLTALGRVAQFEERRDCVVVYRPARLATGSVPVRNPYSGYLPSARAGARPVVIATRSVASVGLRHALQDTRRPAEDRLPPSDAMGRGAGPLWHRVQDVWRILETSVGENNHETATNMSRKFSRHQSVILHHQCTITQ